jgi:hypothetical protein
MVRTDIPDGTLQVLDLQPNTSQRNSIYDPAGQTKYVSFRPQNDTLSLTGVGTITSVGETKGLAAYLVDHIENTNAANIALTAVQANAIADDIISNLLDAAAAAEESDINTEIQNTTGGAVGIGNGNSTATLEDILRILSGDEYVLPAGSTVQDAGAFETDQAGSFSNGGVGRVRHTYDTGALNISVASGDLATFTSATFNYLGTSSRALVVYNDDGTVLS